MKVEVNPARPDFQPVTISITIESLAELAVLYGRFNCSVAVIKHHGFGTDPIGGKLFRASDFSVEDTLEGNRVFDAIFNIVNRYYNVENAT